MQADEPPPDAFQRDAARLRRAPGRMPGGEPQSMWRVIGESLRDTVGLMRSHPRAVLVLLVVELVLGLAQYALTGNSKGSDLPFLSAMVAQLISLVFTFRFCAALMGIDHPQSLPRVVWMRLLGWGIFCVLLGEVGMVSLLPVPLPALVTSVLVLGAAYFQLRLMPLYPALMQWQDWPGIDRVWVPSRGFVLPLIGCILAVFLPITIVVMGVLMALNGGASTNDPVAATAHLQKVLAPLLPALVVGEAFVAAWMVLFSSALRVRLFRRIA